MVEGPVADKEVTIPSREAQAVSTTTKSLIPSRGGLVGGWRPVAYPYGHGWILEYEYLTDSL